MPSLDETFHILRNGELIENPKNITEQDVKVPALDKRWCEKINFVRFKRFEPETITQSCNNSTTDLEEYDERVAFMENDFSYLLRLPHDKFWSQVVYDNSLQHSLDSYLQNVSRDNIGSKLSKLHRLVFMVCLRMSTHKESQDHYFTPKVYGELIYQHYIFDMARLYDIARVYFPTNGKIIAKIIENVFAQQPCYHNDLKASVFTIVTQFESTKNQLDSLRRRSDEAPTTEWLASIQSLYTYVEDVCNTLLTWFKCSPDSAAVAFPEDEFITAIAELYECVFALHQSIIVAGSPSTSTNFSHAVLKLLVKLLHEIVYVSCIKPIQKLTIRKESDPSSYVDKYLELMMCILNNSKFLRHYEVCHPFHIDRCLFGLLDMVIDDTRLDLIEAAFVNASVVEHTATANGKPAPRPSVKSSGPPASSNPAKKANPTTAAAPAVNTPCPGNPEMESMITSVKELLPHLGNGFVEKCLEYYDYNLETVVDILLTENLPGDLDNLDRSLKRTVHEKETRLIDKRRNIFDYDEFDIFHRGNIDKSKIHKGKKNEPIAFKDPETIARLKPLYDLYGNEDLVEGASIYDHEGEGASAYSDIYDDDYNSDSYVGGGPQGAALYADVSDHEADEPPAQNKERFRREPKFNIQEPTSDPQRNRRQDFCMDPAMIREKREAARNANNPQKKQFDVKGNEKGQGQSKDTLKNRAYKEKHKSSNRKAQSDWKRRPQ